MTATTPVAVLDLARAGAIAACTTAVTSSYSSGADWAHEFLTKMVDGCSELLDQLTAHLNGTAT